MYVPCMSVYVVHVRRVLLEQKIFAVYVPCIFQDEVFAFLTQKYKKYQSPSTTQSPSSARPPQPAPPTTSRATRTRRSPRSTSPRTSRRSSGPRRFRARTTPARWPVSLFQADLFQKKVLHQNFFLLVNLQKRGGPLFLLSSLHE